jgi:tripartite-type tricarboxylate transporter receptor subunit TctC
MRFFRSFVALAAVLAGAMAHPSFAEQYPKGPVVFLVPYAPGGTADIVARLIGAKMQEKFGQPFLVENRSGGSEKIATEALLRARPDGQTIAILSNALAINQATEPRPKYDAQTDLVPICRTIEIPFALLLNSSVPANSLPEFIAYAKAHSGKLNYGHLGPGSPHFFIMEWFKKAAGLDILAVPYRGAAPAYEALVGGQVQVVASGLGAATPFINSKQARPIAALSLKRPASQPDLPTIAELGFPEFKLTSWMGLFAPAATPAETVSALERECGSALQDRQLQGKLLQLGLEPAFLQADDFKPFLREEFRTWGAAVEAAAK